MDEKYFEAIKVEFKVLLFHDPHVVGRLHVVNVVDQKNAKIVYFFPTGGGHDSSRLKSRDP